MDALEDLEVWRRACRFSVNTFDMLLLCGEYMFREQLLHSSLSVPSNIAEGYERRAMKERTRFLQIAKGSSGEARARLLIGAEAGFLPHERAIGLADEAKQISRMIGGLIIYFERA